MRLHASVDTSQHTEGWRAPYIGTLENHSSGKCLSLSSKNGANPVADTLDGAPVAAVAATRGGEPQAIHIRQVRSFMCRVGGDGRGEPRAMHAAKRAPEPAAAFGEPMPMRGCRPLVVRRGLITEGQ